MIELRDKNTKELEDWLSNEAGSSNKDYFECNYQGGLMLQQHPAEYADLLIFLRGIQCKTYLEIGIGEGASFMLNCLFLQPDIAIAVDNMRYGQKLRAIEKNIKEARKYVDDVKFFKGNSDTFFAKVPQRKYDVVLIDGDHTYTGVSKDYHNGIKYAKKYIILHDIANGTTGVKKFWHEIKEDGDIEIIQNNNTGIGIKRI